MSVNVSYKDVLYPYVVSTDMLIQNLKEEISEKQNLYQFKLMLGQAMLLDLRPVIKYLFTEFTLCYGNKEAAVEINDYTLKVTVVKPEDQKTFTEQATVDMTVWQLKEKISKKLNSRHEKWTLKKVGKDIPDGDVLKTHLDSKTFTVEMEDMFVIIKDNDRSHTIKTRSDMTILEFKRLCSEKLRNTVEEIGLTFNGEVLEQYEHVDLSTILVAALLGDEALSAVGQELRKRRVVENRTLGSYGIKDRSTVMITAIILGGSSGIHPRNH